MNILRLYFSPSGRINRQTFWLRGVPVILGAVTLYALFFAPIIFLLTNALSLSENVYPFGWLILLAVHFIVLWWLPYAVVAKRLHDLNISAWWYLLYLGTVLVFVFPSFVIGMVSLVDDECLFYYGEWVSYGHWIYYGKCEHILLSLDRLIYGGDLLDWLYPYESIGVHLTISIFEWIALLALPALGILEGSTGPNRYGPPTTAVPLNPQRPANDTGQVIATPTTERAMKNCPYCAESILFEAIKCRYCGADLKEQ